MYQWLSIGVITYRSENQFLLDKYNNAKAYIRKMRIDKENMEQVNPTSSKRKTIGDF